MYKDDADRNVYSCRAPTPPSPRLDSFRRVPPPVHTPNNRALVYAPDPCVDRDCLPPTVNSVNEQRVLSEIGGNSGFIFGKRKNNLRDTRATAAKPFYLRQTIFNEKSQKPRTGTGVLGARIVRRFNIFVFLLLGRCNIENFGRPARGIKWK